MTNTTATRFRALADLVSERREALGLSYRALAEVSGLALTTVHKIANAHLVKAPNRETIIALAGALRLPEQSLTAALATDIGLQELVIEDGDLRAIYLAAKPLTKAERAAVLNILQSMTRDRLREQRYGGEG